MTGLASPPRNGGQSASARDRPAARSAAPAWGLLSWAPRVVAGALFAVSMYGVFATFQHNTELVSGQEGVVAYGAGVAGLLGVSACVWAERRRLDALGRVLLRWASRVSPGRWLCGCLAFGCAVRVGWNVLFPPIQRSDMATYMSLARGLLERHEYVTDGSYAYWAPGLPFALVPVLAALPQESWVPAVSNLIWFGIAVLATYWLGVLSVDDPLAKVGVLGVTLWPNLIFLSGLAAKELILVAVLPIALATYLTASRTTSRFSFWGVVSGAVLGYGVLTQPSLLLLGVVFLCYELARGDGPANRGRNVVALVLGMVLVISPWTARNYRVFHTLVVVNTAGGNSLYQGNNSQATGAYVPGLMDELNRYDELTAARIARQRAIAWIQAHPGRFALLAFRKQILLLGDDSSGAYGTLKRGLAMGGVTYALLKGVSNAYWIVVLTLVSVAVRRRWRTRLVDRPEIALLGLPLLYFLGVHSVFESDGRHHVAIVVPLVLVAALALSDPAAGTDMTPTPRA